MVDIDDDKYGYSGNIQIEYDYETKERQLDDLCEDKERQYEIAARAKVGTALRCSNLCGRVFTKKVYQQRFCSTRCKDRYWNTTDPIRRERASRYA